MKNGKNLSTASEHRRHDRLLVTRFAMDDAYPSELDEAKSLVESCIECAALANDIRLISGAMTTVPSLSRPRDFSITQEQADRLRGSALSRLLRRLGASAPLWGTVRPVAAAALSIGLVAAVFGTALPNQAATFDNRSSVRVPMTAAAETSAPAEEDTPPEIGAPAGPLASAAPGYAQEPLRQDAASEAIDEAYITGADGGESTGVGGTEDEGTTALTPSVAAATPASPKDLLIYVGLVVALISAALLTVAWIARRYFADPLLR